MSEDEAEAAPEDASEASEEAPRVAKKQRVEREERSETEKDDPTVKKKPTPPNPVQMSWKTMVYAFMATAIIFLLIDNSARIACGLTLSAVLTPAIGFGGLLPVLTLMIAGNVMAIISLSVRQYLIDWVDTARVQHLSRWLNKVRMESFRSRSQQRMDEAAELQKKYAGEMWKMQKTQFKSMGFTFLPVIAVFAWLGIFIGEAAYPVFSVPWAEQVYFTPVIAIFPAWILLYGLVSLPVSLVLQKGLKYLAFKRKLEALESGEADEEEG
ncbi:MAG TPA: EMC3/TMCO1 family protein [Thermoplasmata archaeon]|nr:EMC3/TMCO1 family protein [Thermoplasmata archaeon]